MAYTMKQGLGVVLPSLQIGDDDRLLDNGHHHFHADISSFELNVDGSGDKRSTSHLVNDEIKFSLSSLSHSTSILSLLTVVQHIQQSGTGKVS